MRGMHHSFDIELAAEYGVEEAILIHHFQHWIRVNKRLNRNFHEDRTWTYQTYEEIAANFPYLSYAKVRYAISNLEKRGILLKGNFNKRKGDLTVWFAFFDEKQFIGENAPKSIPSSQEMLNLAGVCENSQGSVKIDRALPDTIPDTKKHEHEHAGADASFEDDVKKVPELKNQGTLQEKVDYLKKIKLPNGAPLSQRNIETWSRLYSLWRIKKAVHAVRRKLEKGEELTNPEGLFFTILKDPNSESDEATENARSAALKWIKEHDKDYEVLDTYVVDYATQKDVMLSFGASRVIEELERWANVR